MNDTVIYLVRHAQSDFSVREEMLRPLTSKGWEDRLKVTECLRGEAIEAIYSSPYKRALDTIRDFAEEKGLPITEVAELRERSAGNEWVTQEEFWRRERSSWEDLSLKFAGEESIGEVQARIRPVSDRICTENIGRKIAVAGHGTAFCVLLHSFDSAFGFAEYHKLCLRNPWIIKLIFGEGKLISREELL